MTPIAPAALACLAFHFVSAVAIAQDLDEGKVKSLYLTRPQMASLAKQLNPNDLPLSLRLRVDPSKRSFADYGYVVERADANSIVLFSRPMSSRLEMSFLECRNRNLVVFLRETAFCGNVQVEALFSVLRNSYDGFFCAHPRKWSVLTRSK